MEPVGEGAIRVRTGRLGIEVRGLSEAGVGETGADAAALSTRLRAADSLAAAGRWLAGQGARQAGRTALWAPVAFGLGAALYFALPREPKLVLAALVLLAAAGLGVAARRWAGGRMVATVLVLCAFGLAGFSAAKLRAVRVAAPVMAGEASPRAVEAFVVDVDSPGQSGARVLLAPIRIGGLAPEATPIRIRVTLRDDQAPPPPGATVAVRAILNAPPPPASPGSYDFARDAYFEGIGAVGFSLTPLRQIADRPAPWRLGLTMEVNAVRWALAQRIVAAMGPQTGGLAAAMTTGHEAFVPREQVDQMRDAGLAHIISISGLHMAIVGGFAFYAVRLGVAAWPWLALRTSGKKLAALAGLAAVGGYLLLSGAPAPAERAAITAAAAFGAMLADRRAISLHSLAIAALAILALQPEAVTEPGFQMSFAATAALVALAELMARPIREISAPWWIRAIQGAGTWVGVSLAASFVAGLATGPFAMQHFNRVAVWGLPANLLVAPVSSFVMMPFLAIGAVLAPLGLGDWALTVAGWGIAAMTWIAGHAAAAPGATLTVASAPAWALPAAFLGVLWLCLWKGPLRWLGLPLALAVTLAPRGPAPDIWVAADGAAVAMRHGHEAVLLRPDAKLFASELWARRRGLALPEDAETARAALFDCGRWACASRGDAPVAAIWSKRAPTAEELAKVCAGAEVVVIRSVIARPDCAAPLVLTGGDFVRGGSAELYRTAQGWRIVWAQDLRGRRPWTWGAS